MLHMGICIDGQGKPFDLACRLDPVRTGDLTRTRSKAADSLPALEAVVRRGVSAATYAVGARGAQQYRR